MFFFFSQRDCRRVYVTRELKLSWDDEKKNRFWRMMGIDEVWSIGGGGTRIPNELVWIKLSIFITPSLKLKTDYSQIVDLPLSPHKHTYHRRSQFNNIVHHRSKQSQINQQELYNCILLFPLDLSITKISMCRKFLFHDVTGFGNSVHRDTFGINKETMLEIK